VANSAATDSSAWAVTEVPEQGVPGVVLPRTYSEGSSVLYIGGDPSITAREGILLATVRQNERDGIQATAAVAYTAAGGGSLSVSTAEAGAGAFNPVNMDTALAWFPFRAGWQGAYIATDGSVVIGNKVTQDMVTRLASPGHYAVDPGGDSRTQGMLFTTPIGYGSKYITTTGVFPDGHGWDVRTQLNNTDYMDNGASIGFAFLYVPFAHTEGLVGGRYDGIAGTSLISQGDFTMSRLDIGQYLLTLPNDTPQTGMLLLSASYNMSDLWYQDQWDNILSYEDDGSGNFLIRAFDLPGLTPEDAQFAWAFVSFYEPLTFLVPEPTSLVLLGAAFAALGVRYRSRRRAAGRASRHTT